MFPLILLALMAPIRLGISLSQDTGAQVERWEQSSGDIIRGLYIRTILEGE